MEKLQFNLGRVDKDLISQFRRIKNKIFQAEPGIITNEKALEVIFKMAEKRLDDLIQES